MQFCPESLLAALSHCVQQGQSSPFEDYNRDRFECSSTFCVRHTSSNIPLSADVILPGHGTSSLGGAQTSPKHPSCSSVAPVPPEYVVSHLLVQAAGRMGGCGFPHQGDRVPHLSANDLSLVTPLNLSKPHCLSLCEADAARSALSAWWASWGQPCRVCQHQLNVHFQTASPFPGDEQSGDKTAQQRAHTWGGYCPPSITLSKGDASL